MSKTKQYPEYKATKTEAEAFRPETQEQSVTVQMRLNSLTKNVFRDRIEEMEAKGWVLV